MWDIITSTGNNCRLVDQLSHHFGHDLVFHFFYFMLTALAAWLFNSLYKNQFCWIRLAFLARCGGHLMRIYFPVNAGPVHRCVFALATSVFGAFFPFSFTLSSICSFPYHQHDVARYTQFLLRAFGGTSDFTVRTW
jgi:hypothetical protein